MQIALHQSIFSPVFNAPRGVLHKKTRGVDSGYLRLGFLILDGGFPVAIHK
jgi:hypothetical protein